MTLRDSIRDDKIPRMNAGPISLPWTLIILIVLMISYLIATRRKKKPPPFPYPPMTHFEALRLHHLEKQQIVEPRGCLDAMAGIAGLAASIYLSRFMPDWF